MSLVLIQEDPVESFGAFFSDGVVTSYCIGNDHQQYFFHKNVPALQVILAYPAFAFECTSGFDMTTSHTMPSHIAGNISGN